MDYLIGFIVIAMVIWLSVSGPRRIKREDSPEIKRSLARQEKYHALLAIGLLLFVVWYFSVDQIMTNIHYIAEKTQQGIEQDRRERK